MKMLRSWSPQPADSIMHKDNISITARLTHVALLRAQNMHKEALDISLRLVRGIRQGLFRGLLQPFV